MRVSICLLAVIPLLAAGFMHQTGATAAPETACLRDGPEYIGVDGCKKCHFPQWMSWKKTDMAKAFDTLKPGKATEEKKKHGLDPEMDYTKNGECVACHTTGYGQPGGYPALVEGKSWTDDEKKRAEAMEGVQCESCHGPGSLTAPYKKDHEDYKKEKLLEMGMVNPEAAVCAGCHNTKSPTVPKDYKMDYEKMSKDDKQVHAHKELKKQH